MPGPPQRNHLVPTLCVGMPSWTLRVLSDGCRTKTTQSVEDGIPTEDRGNEFPILRGRVRRAVSFFCRQLCFLGWKLKQGGILTINSADSKVIGDARPIPPASPLQGGENAQRNPRESHPPRRRFFHPSLVLVVLGIAAAGALFKLRGELSVQALARETRRLVAEQKFEQARGPLERWLKARPSSAEAWFLAAQEMFAANGPEQGFQALERARTLGYPSQKIERQKAIILSRLGRHNEAEPGLRRLLLSSSQPDPEADEALAKCYLETFQLGQAETVIDRWIHDSPGR